MSGSENCVARSGVEGAQKSMSQSFRRQFIQVFVREQSRGLVDVVLPSHVFLPHLRTSTAAHIILHKTNRLAV